MSIDFAIGESADTIRWNCYVPLQQELLAYFRRLEASAGMSVPFFTSLDPYGDAMFTRQEIEQIGADLETLMRHLERLFQQGELPPDLEPPAVVGLETDPEGEPCGRSGAIRIIASLRCLLGDAVKCNLPVWALGD